MIDIGLAIGWAFNEGWECLHQAIASSTWFQHSCFFLFLSVFFFVNATHLRVVSLVADLPGTVVEVSPFDRQRITIPNRDKSFTVVIKLSPWNEQIIVTNHYSPPLIIIGKI